MNFENIKNNFEIYLKNIRNDKDDSKYSEIQDANFNIFDYATEFQDFVNSEYIFNNNIEAENIDEILEMEVFNGQLTTKEEYEKISKDIQESTFPSKFEKMLFSKNSTSLINEKEKTQKENSVITDLLKELSQNEDFIKALDTNNNNSLNTEELQTFIEQANKLDLDTENLSLEDIMSGLSILVQGKNLKEAAEEKTLEAQEKTQQVNTTKNTPTNLKTNTSIQTAKDRVIESAEEKIGKGINAAIKSFELSTMSREELSKEKELATNNLKAKESNLTNIINGNNSTLKTLNKKVENIYKIYQEQLNSVNKDLAEEVDTLKNSIEEQDTQISANEATIVEKETEIRNYKSSYSEQKTRTSAYKEQLSSLQGKYNEATTDKNKSELANLITNLKAKISEAEANEKEFSEKIEKKRQEVANLKEQNKTLKQSKTEIETQLSEKETEINKKYPEISKYLNYYNEAKNYYNEQKTELTTNAKSELKTAQTYLNQVKTAFSNSYKDNVLENYKNNEYNAEAGNKLTANAKQVEAEMSGTGLCLKAVKTALKRTYPEYEKLISNTEGYSSAYQFAKALSGEDERFKDFSKNFKEIECSTDDIGKLPAGAIVVYSQNTSKPHGHIAIMDGEGNQYSDWTKSQEEMSNYYQREFWNKGSTIRVFVPTQ